MLLSPDHHFDNLDNSGRALLQTVGVTYTTASGAERLGGNAIGITPFETRILECLSGKKLLVTATPARHGLIGVDAGDVIGFVLGVKQRGDLMYITGDTLWFEGTAEVEASFDDYPEALLASLRKSIRFVRDQNKWDAGDPVRLIFHVYKPLKRSEIQAAKVLVDDMLKEYSIEFAFLDLSHHHPFQIFDSTQDGIEYWSYDLGRKATKGVYAPARGSAMLLGSRMALLQLVGARGQDMGTGHAASAFAGAARRLGFL